MHVDETGRGYVAIAVGKVFGWAILDSGTTAHSMSWEAWLEAFGREPEGISASISDFGGTRRRMVVVPWVDLEVRSCSEPPGGKS